MGQYNEKKTDEDEQAQIEEEFKDIEGVEYFGYEMEFVEGICLNTNDGLWDWKEKTSKRAIPIFPI